MTRTQSFYFTEIGFPVATGPAADDNNTTADVVVMNRHGVAAYQFDTSLGGPNAGDCFGDQPKTGFNNNALVISTDEYCGPTESNYEGAIALVISKPELVAEAATVSDSVVGPVSLAGNPVVGMDPAIGTGTGTGYLVNSVPFLANGNNNPVGNTLGLWTLTDSAAVTTGHGTVSLTGKVLPSEPYAFPVPATSTGDGSTTTVNGMVVTSETALNPDDSRLSGPVEVTRGLGGQIQLWTALDAAVARTGTRRPGRCRVVQDQRHPRVRGPAGIRDRQGRQPALPGHRSAAVRQPRDGVHDHQRNHQPERGVHPPGLRPDHHGSRRNRSAPELLRRAALQRAPLG